MGRLGIAVSVIVPNYNHGRVLPFSIASLQRQSVAPLEIIVVDDGSSDDSREVAARLAMADPRIRLIVHERNAGVVAAMNAGVAAARGDLVYLGAADDVAGPDLIETLTGLAARYPGLGLYCGEIRLVDLHTGAVGLRPAARPSAGPQQFSPDQTRSMLRRIDNFILTSAALLDRQKLLAAGGLRLELGSFADGFLVRQLALRHGFAFVPRVLAEWRVAREGVSRKAAADKTAVAELIVAAGKGFATDPAFPADYPRRFEHRWRFGVLRLAIADLAANRGLVDAIATQPAFMARLLMGLGRVPLVGKQLASMALFLAYRPFSLGAILGTAVQRRLS